MQTTGVRRAPAGPDPQVLTASTVRRRFGRISPWTVDIVTVALVAAIVLVEAALPSELHRSDPVISLTINLLAVLALLLRRRAPVLTLALISAVLGLPTLVVMHDLSFWGILLCIGLSHYMVVRLCTLRTAWLSLLFPAVGIGGYWALTPALRGDPGLLAFLSLIFTVTFVSGRLARKDAERRRELTAALTRLTGEQEERHRLAVLDERSALARDLHDVVAHALSLMNVSAQQARDALPDDLGAARTSVLTLETAGRHATADLRRMLGLLRENDSIASATEPTPDLDQLPVLVERMRSAGLQIAWHDALGSPRELPAGLELAALRIVQESLTNVLRHAGPAGVRLRVDVSAPSAPSARSAPTAPETGEPTRSGRVMIIEVIDSGSTTTGPARVPAARDGVAGSDAGHGLVGMRERVELYGGTMIAGPRDRGFAVRVELPVPA